MKTVKYEPNGLATVFGGIIGWLLMSWFVKMRKQKPFEWQQRQNETTDDRINQLLAESFHRKVQTGETQ
jgi:membrane protein YqaA with SNARE-associated domain